MRSTEGFLLVVSITLDLAFFLFATDCEICSPEQRQVLMDIYISTNGEGWLKKDGWNSSTPTKLADSCSHCAWYGITCQCGKSVMCTMCDVTGIFLQDNNLNGTLPRSVRKLRHLETLALNSNKNLKGELDDFISGNMSNLQELNLSFCSFSGRIPESIAKFKNLRVLRLGENNLTGPLPFGFGTLRNLEVLDLDSVNINARFDMFCNLTKLLFLNLSKTKIFGKLPSNIGKLFPKITELLLPGNYINGTIPHSIGMMERLTRLSLANNRLSGAIPGNITENSNLKFIDLSENNYLSISGNNDSFISDNLEILVLSDNPRLNVNFKHFLNRKYHKNPAKLKVLILKSCQFHGEIPRSIWSYWNLIYVDIAKNNLTGRLPEVHLPMYTLLHFDISDNPGLEGPIPPTLLRTEWLHKLDIRGNLNMIVCKENDNKSICQATLSNHGIEIDYRSFHKLTGNQHFSCPNAKLKVTKGRLFLDPKYYGYTFCQCDRDYYGEGRRCRRCLKNGKCLGNHQTHMTIRKGHWPEPNPQNATKLTLCNDRVDFFSRTNLLNCNPNGNCTCVLSASNETICESVCLCRKGSIGRLCSHCQEMWYKSGNICERCPSHHHATYIFIGVLLATLAVFAIASLYLKNRPRLSLLISYGQISILFTLRCFYLIPGWVFEFNAIVLLFYLAGIGHSSKGLLKVAVFYIQILDAMLSTYKQWPNKITQGQQYISSIINFHLQGLMCDIPHLYTPTGQFLSLILLPVICISSTWFFYLLARIAYKIEIHRWNILSVKLHCLQIIVTCLNLTYFPIVLRSIAVLASCQDKVISYMRIAPWVACSSSTSNLLYGFAWASTIFYVIGVPLLVFLPLLTYFVRGNKRSLLKEHEKEAMDKWLGSIYLPYKERYRSFFEVYALLRKLLLAFMIGYLPEGSSEQTFFVSLVLTTALTIHLVWQPYLSSFGWIPIENILETIILVVLQHSFILLRFTSVRKEKRANLLWIIIAVNCLVVFFLIVIISVLLANRAAKSLKRRSKTDNCESKNIEDDELFTPLLMRNTNTAPE